MTISDAESRRRRAALSGHTGDEAAARSGLGDPDPGVKTTALRALARIGAATIADVAAALADPDPAVRRAACQVAAREASLTSPSAAQLVALLADDDPSVVEMAAWALGEIGTGVNELAAVATSHSDALCREAAVAALGAIGDETGLRAILSATADKANVRRRAVIALAPFSGPEVDAALAKAREDRDWQVRQAAEDLS